MLPKVQVSLIRRLLSEGGTVPLRVVGSSMLPLLPSGSEVVLKKQERLRPGDLIAIDTPDGIVLHRYFGRGFFGRWHGLLLAKGDSAMRFDPPIAPESVIGVVTPIGRSVCRHLFAPLALPLSLAVALLLW